MIRKTLVLTAALFALIVASAQAHAVQVSATCGLVTIQWYNFNDGSHGNNLNGGVNTPSYAVAFTPVGQSSPITPFPSGQVSFGNTITQRNVVQYTTTVAIPPVNGNVVVYSAWTAQQTSDGDAETATVSNAITNCVHQPSIKTSASAGGPIGTQITDTATLSGGYNPTGSITWRLYGPNDPTCTNPNAPSVTITNVNGDKSYISPPLSPTQAGTYTWVATYDGDINNSSVAGKCTDANETVTISPLNPAIRTSASAGGPIGTQITDTATLSGGQDPTGSIVWKLYGPNDPTCSAANPPSVRVDNVNGDKGYTSPPLTPTAAGTYTWVASYLGDSNNNPVAGQCTDANETVTISPLSPTIKTSASVGGPIGTAITDTATLAGGDNPTGSIVWKLYGPNDPTCSAANPPSVRVDNVNGDKGYTSPPLTPTAAGTYTWVASYLGDSNNNPVAGQCTDANETVTISPLSPTIKTSASVGGPIGTAITDTATLAGGDNPTGSIVWKLYGPNDPTCSAANPPSVRVDNVNGDKGYTSPPLTPTEAGTYTWIASYLGDSNNNPVAGQCTDANETVTITSLNPAIRTSASVGGPIGTQITDTATLSGGQDPTGSIVWKLYGPNDPTCSAANPPSVRVDNVNGDKGYTSPPLTPTHAGTYTWIASYLGDNNNNPVAGQCTDVDETVTISPLTPAIKTSAAIGGPIGTAITDTATLSGGQDPTGSIVWKLYGPNDPTCSAGNPPSVRIDNVNGDKGYTSPSITPTEAGTYTWVASYLGDSDNNPVAGQCTDANETVTISSLNPTISTSASVGGPIGTAITDTATLAGGQNPTGSITWTLYGPNDSTCSNTKAPTVTGPVTGDGKYTSPPLTPTAAGTYTWVASYLGDGNNNPVAGKCTDANETVSIGQVAPVLTTTATPSSVTIGGSVTDVAHLTGGDNPTGSITWALYGPNDDSCTSASPQTTASVPVTSDGDYTSPPLKPSAGGTYHWVATYSGDANNGAVGPVGCNDPNETLTVLAPSFTMQKLQSLSSTTGFTSSPITAQVGQTIYYEVVVTNTGNTPLQIPLNDTLCSGISGPTGNIAGGNLQVGGTATYTCSARRGGGRLPDLRERRAGHGDAAGRQPAAARAQLGAGQRAAPAGPGLHGVHHQAHADHEDHQDRAQRQRQDDHHHQQADHRDPQRSQSRDRHQAGELLSRRSQGEDAHQAEPVRRPVRGPGVHGEHALRRPQDHGVGDDDLRAGPDQGGHLPARRAGDPRDPAVHRLSEADRQAGADARRPPLRAISR